MYGCLVTGRGAYATKSIFLPAAGYGFGSYLDLYYAGSYGYYWSSTSHSDNSDFAWFLVFYSGTFNRTNYVRNLGHSVRPLRGFAK